uniref:SWIM zinc finger n=1 Tax=Candidatus Kentrum sp. FM TaxID=2126340 RepID=A0A450X1T8_9GAMM|nr:MAG: SWIM zinc finger [Candidatus Kentron sp. FM]VFJ62925.1 MAG: SWIM zinc finger [Candidatus Kentron sp. FM]VFK23262.1 MAG: SWIM zinc finger [Candidatus Kentron sp. FM]
MSRYGGWWPRYVPVAERREKAMRQMEKLRKKGHPVDPVVIDGRTIASTFWGKAWCKNLESYHDFENRLPRGRTYVRNGSVVNLQIASKEVRAMVSGSSIYKVDIRVAALPKAVWKGICEDCAGGIDSLVELLQGRFNKGVMDRLCRQDKGLFPKPSEIHFSCSCPDIAYMCKHVAAVLYGIGSRLDKKPELLFLLRAVDQNDLVVDLDAALPLAGQGPEAGKRLETDDISQLFGLDMAEGDVGTGQTEKPRPAAKTTANKKPAKTGKPRPAAAKKQEKAAWLEIVEIEALISRRNESGYKRATAMLIELRDDARETRKIKEFSRRLATLRARHQRKRRFIERLDAAGLK